MISFGMGPVRGEDGTLAVTFPLADAALPSIAASDIGACAYGIFRDGAKLDRPQRRHRRRAPDRIGHGRGAR